MCLEAGEGWIGYRSEGRGFRWVWGWRIVGLVGVDGRVCFIWYTRLYSTYLVCAWLVSGMRWWERTGHVSMRV